MNVKHKVDDQIIIDLLGPLPLEIPPLHEVLHEIPLIEESKQLKHGFPKCPEAFHPELAQKLSNTPQQGGGSLQQISRPHICCDSEKEQYIAHHIQSETTEQ